MWGGGGVQRGSVLCLAEMSLRVVSAGSSGSHWPSGVSMSSARRCSSKAVTVQMSRGSSDFLRISGRSRRCSFWI